MKITTEENKENFRKQYHSALASLGSELVNCIPEFIDALLANSVIVWADFFGSLEVTAHYFFVSLITKRMVDDDGTRYNYGVTRLETMVSFICDAFLIISYLVVIGISVVQLGSPSQPTDAIGIFLLLKLLNISFDLFFYVQKKILQKKHPSLLNESEAAMLEDELIEDTLMGIIVCICYFFRSYRWSWYVSPIATIILSAVFTFDAIKRLHSAFGEITDVSTTVADQDKMLDILLEYRKSFKKIREVNCHFLNHKLMVDIIASFKEEVTYSQQETLLKAISEKANEEFNDATIRFVIESEDGSRILRTGKENESL